MSCEIIYKHLNEKNIFLYGNKNNQWILAKTQRNDISQKILNFILDFHKKNKYVKGVTKEQINAILNIDINLLHLILTSLVKENIIKFNNEIYFSNNFKINLDEKDKRIQSDIIEYLNKQKFHTSNIKELADTFNYDENKISKLLKIENNNNVIIIIKVLILNPLCRIVNINNYFYIYPTNHY